MKRYWSVWLGAVLLLSLMGVPPTDGGAHHATPAAVEPCPVTEPNGNNPPSGETVAGRGAGGYGNDALWTNVWMWGGGVVMPAYDDHVEDDGTLHVVGKRRTRALSRVRVAPTFGPGAWGLRFAGTF